MVLVEGTSGILETLITLAAYSHTDYTRSLLTDYTRSPLTH
jgi:hypothetical protein